jgi:hypothetical protein
MAHFTINYAVSLSPLSQFLMSFRDTSRTLGRAAIGGQRTSKGTQTTSFVLHPATLADCLCGADLV